MDRGQDFGKDARSHGARLRPATSQSAGKGRAQSCRWNAERANELQSGGAWQARIRRLALAAARTTLAPVVNARVCCRIASGNASRKHGCASSSSTVAGEFTSSRLSSSEEANLVCVAPSAVIVVWALPRDIEAK